ncbi:hypothetical protein IWX49DRAFT_557152 [Phyllosticta citricarpa]|uniref:AA1-like domain-containing protein n=2 Tax=Phyllosticta TaxID=121621 RepID=A0ABR1LDX3_9PEZI
MLANTLTSALAVFAVAASAAPASAPAPAVDLSALKTGYNWNLTSITSSYTPSGNYRSLDFTIAFSAQPNTTHCASGYGANGNLGGKYEPCANAAVTFSSDLGVSSVSISQLFVYNGVNVRVNGSAPLDLYGGSNCKTNTVGGGTCSQSQLTVKVSSATVASPKKGN